MSTSNTYEIVGRYRELLALLNDEDMDPEALADTFEALDGELEAKADNIARVLKNLDRNLAALDAEREAVSDELTRINSRYIAICNNEKRLKGMLEDAMRATGKMKFKTDLFSFGIQKNPKSAVIADGTNINELPAEFLTFSAPRINKNAVKEYLEAGNTLEWAELVQTERLAIR